MSLEASSPDVASHDDGLRAITEPILQEVLRKDVGPQARFKSYEIRDFCAKGDNFACYVTSVAVTYTLGADERKATYVAKLNHFKETDSSGFFLVNIFEKEGRFYCELVPALNKIRSSLSLAPLKFPSCFFASSEARQELLMLEDLRNTSFRMADYKARLDDDHVVLVMKELANLHATSVILEEQMGTEKFLATFGFFQDAFISDVMSPMLKETLVGYVQNGVRAAEKLPGYEKVVERLRGAASRSFEHLVAAMENVDPKFRAVGHGDATTNNMLFRYEGDRVADVRLLDLQGNRHNSLAIDLNHFLFTSCDGRTKEESLASYLSAYYDAFSTVFDAAKKPMKFSLEELHKEYRRKNTYGVLMGFMSLTFHGLKSADVPDLAELNSENLAENVKDVETKLCAVIDTDPMWKSRLEDLLQEVEKHGIF